ncbi:MFS transporter [Rhodovarius crocodyli]|uniref:MFS transporter n=1 Tax=Rhodovarius crocodyli TaxID=1979269 RepID=A0A437MCF2_9PROT|nr:MFS transporter [Rhodovarius crocodyli]RVT95320.1 MFS transporter [Rhodovarius crocodyli]
MSTYAPHPQRILMLALGAMFLQQSFATLGRSLPPILAPAIVADLSLDPAWLGVYIGISSAAALVFQLGCGSFILRYGALRFSQIALLLLAAGLGLAAAGPMVFFLFSAILGGGGAATSTPASSHLLGRYVTARQAPLIYSIKQTAVPAGLLAAGLLGPLLTGMWGWRWALVASAIAAVAFALVLQPLRAEFDSDRLPGKSFRLSDFWTTIQVVLRPGLRPYAFGCLMFNGLQAVFTTYFVLFLTELGHSLTAAGALFAVAMIIAVPGRIFWGWLGSGRVEPRLLLGGLSLGMAGSAVLMPLVTPAWPMLGIGVIATGFSATAMSWHGVLLAETARLAPDGMHGHCTGGVLSFGQVGALILPLVYAGVLLTTGSHGLGFAICGAPGFVVGWWLMRRR